MAVLVMIDGGNGLNTGGQDPSTTKGIVSNLVKRGIVVVTLQYRIGALGKLAHLTQNNFSKVFSRPTPMLFNRIWACWIK